MSTLSLRSAGTCAHRLAKPGTGGWVRVGNVKRTVDDRDTGRAQISYPARRRVEKSNDVGQLREALKRASERESTFAKGAGPIPRVEARPHCLPRTPIFCACDCLSVRSATSICDADLSPPRLHRLNFNLEQLSLNSTSSMAAVNPTSAFPTAPESPKTVQAASGASNAASVAKRCVMRRVNFRREMRRRTPWDRRRNPQGRSGFVLSVTGCYKRLCANRTPQRNSYIPFTSSNARLTLPSLASHRLQSELMSLMMSPPAAGITAFPESDSDLTYWVGRLEGAEVRFARLLDLCFADGAPLMVPLCRS